MNTANVKANLTRMSRTQRGLVRAVMVVGVEQSRDQIKELQQRIVDSNTVIGLVDELDKPED